MNKIRRAKSDTKMNKIRRAKSETELTRIYYRKQKYRDKESQTEWCLTKRKERKRGFQIYQTISKAVRITLNVTNKNNLPIDLTDTGTLDVSFRQIAPYYEEETQHVSIILSSPTCNETISWILEQDLGRNAELVFCLKRIDDDGETITTEENHPIGKKYERMVDIDFKNGIIFTVQITYQSTPDIEIRNCEELSSEEKNYCTNRRQEVFRKLRDNLGEDFVSKVDNVPNIAIIGSGGGMRAVIGMSGAMTALNMLHMLDYPMYTAGLSGSAWYLMTLYAYDDNFNPETVNGHIRKRLHDNSGTFIRMGLKILLRFAYVVFFGPAKLVTCTNIFGEMIGRILLGEKCKHKWSEQAMKLKEGSIPLPLLAALHVRLERTRHEYNEWIELSPYQVLLPSYGVAIKMSTFGDNFFRGFRTKEFEETPIHFLKGMCGSAYTIARDQRPKEKSMGNLYLRDRMMLWANVFDIAVVARIPNFLRSIWGLNKIAKYEGSDQFMELDDSGRCRCTHRGTILGKFCRKLENWISVVLSAVCGPALEFLIHLFGGFKQTVRFAEGSVKDDNDMLIVDAGIEFNSPYPLVLHPARQVDLIISFDFSDRVRDGELPFGELIKAAKWAKQRGVPFPELHPYIDEMEKNWIDGNRKEVYTFRGENAPTIMHFVMINNSFRDQDAAHKFDIHPTYGTLRFSYSTDEFDQFQKMVHHNVVENQMKIFRCIRDEVEKYEQFDRILENLELSD